MNEINLFREMLQQHLQWNGARLAFVSTFLIALMRVKTVNMVEIATGFSGKAKVESHYKRLQRFFKDFELDYSSIALMVVRVMKIPEPWVIFIDRTDWQFGKTIFNVLMLGVVHHGVAFPFVWIMLDKKGNSNTRERCGLWNRFLEIFGDRKIAFLTVDREFVGEDCFDYLLCEPHTLFRVRVRKNTLLDDSQKVLPASVCFQNLQVGESMVLSQKRLIWGHSVGLLLLRFGLFKINLSNSKSMDVCLKVFFALVSILCVTLFSIYSPILTILLRLLIFCPVFRKTCEKTISISYLLS